MQIDKNKFIEGIAKSFVCPKDFGIEVSKEGKICGYSVDCQKCWDEALEEVSNIELIGGIQECQK
ncbi:hypothetical protein [Clostridium sp.]|uniref:hypothetical protein n=1 Tax=Clostridium sp. TaxID=1506 RepID=UPI00283C1363|nr:hypothetical protein [Clostridium sp.]MDR3593810.1 hypothetical protein [Clostridium sp.]